MTELEKFEKYLESEIESIVKLLKKELNDIFLGYPPNMTDSVIISKYGCPFQKRIVEEYKTTLQVLKQYKEKI